MTMKNDGETKKEDVAPPIPSAPFSYDADDAWMSSTAAAAHEHPHPSTVPPPRVSQPHASSAPLSSSSSSSRGPRPYYGGSNGRGTNKSSATLWQVLSNPNNYESLLHRVTPTTTTATGATHNMNSERVADASVVARGFNTKSADDSKIPMVTATPIVDSSPITLPVVVATEDLRNVSATTMTTRPPFCRPERADLLPDRHCWSMLPLPDQYPVPREEHAPSHWTHPKATSEILTDLDWTDDEAQEVAKLLYKRSAACSWVMNAGAVAGFMFVLMIVTGGCESDCSGQPIMGGSILMLVVSAVVAFPFLHLVTSADRKVTRIVDRTFREDGTRFEIVV